MKLLSVSLPVLVHSHGVLLPATKNVDQAREAGSWSLQVIESAVNTCRDQLSHCSVANLGAAHWEVGFECLTTGKANLDAVCSNKIAAAAQHYPAAKFASMTPEAAHKYLTEPQNGTNYGCHPETDNPYIWSYHIHLQWDEEGREDSFAFQRAFRETWMGGADVIIPCRQFAYIEDLWNFNSIPMEDVEHHVYAEPCQQFAMIDDYDTWPSFPRGGPFYHNNTGFLLSPLTWHKVWPWVMKNRPLSDKVWVFNHPNTGCQYHDLRHWSAWTGDSLDMFYDILGQFNGCLWAGCNDKQFGCISGHQEPLYGDCFTPPTELNVAGKMTFLPGSNTTSFEWPRPSLLV